MHDGDIFIVEGEKYVTAKNPKQAGYPICTMNFHNLRLHVTALEFSKKEALKAYLLRSTCIE